MVEEETEEEAWRGRVRRLTDWGIIAPGEGGNKIASLFFSTRNNEAIKDRILLLNTAHADIKNAIESISNRVVSDRARELLEKIANQNVQAFANQPGGGNFWPFGEEFMKRDFEGEEMVRRKIESVGINICSAIYDITTLGGGTGCGSTPYTIYRTKKDGIIEGGHFALAIWPEDREGGQRHFNAICGLSRLLKYDGEQNADLCILISNTCLVDYINKESSESLSEIRVPEDRHHRMNNVIADVMELMIAPGRGKSDTTVEWTDYTGLPAAFGVYHAVPCLSMNNDVELFSIEAALDDAVSIPLFPIKPKTASMVWAIFRVPQDYYGVDEFEPERISEKFDAWAESNLIGEVKYTAITYNERKKEKFDVLLLLGGSSFDITNSYNIYKKFKKTLSTRGENIILPERTKKIILPVKTLDALENNLDNYILHTEKVQEKLSEEEL